MLLSAIVDEVSRAPLSLHSVRLHFCSQALLFMKEQPTLAGVTFFNSGFIISSIHYSNGDIAFCRAGSHGTYLSSWLLCSLKACSPRLYHTRISLRRSSLSQSCIVLHHLSSLLHPQSSSCSTILPHDFRSRRRCVAACADTNVLVPLAWLLVHRFF